MDETLSYDYLWQAYQKEKQTNQLLLLSKNFYDDVTEFINGGSLASTGIEPSMRDNAKRLLNEFFEKRKQKIMIYIAYNRQLPQPVSSNELEFYNKVLQIVKSERLDPPKSKEVKQTQTFKPMLKSIKDIPEIILPSGSKFGPLRKDQTFQADNEEDKIYLVENAICEEVR